ncbi:MAG TPA: HNH endonuclease signature motif containing protein, partial [Kofleriaceae bacterium]|nr:HNH endonuclease signature motif containing protein [Kofleriaceae bacterium]
MAIDGRESILVDWFGGHSALTMNDRALIGPGARRRSLCRRNDDVGSISRRPTRIVAWRAFSGIQIVRDRRSARKIRRLAMLRDGVEESVIEGNLDLVPTWAPAGRSPGAEMARPARARPARSPATPRSEVEESPRPSTQKSQQPKPSEMRRSTPRESPVPLQQPAEPRWRVVDRALREIAARRAALDAEEAQWLREAEALQIWRQLGMVSALDYLERVLHYSPRTAQDRLRVARALGALPELTAALADGRLSHSAVRELTRVATPATEAAWLADAVGKNLRQVEEMVAHHRPGDGPDDPPDPEPQTHVVRFELSAETYALLRQTRVVLDDEHGTNLSEDAFVTALCSAVLDGAPTGEPTGRAKFQIAMTVCERCRKGWQEGAGAQIVVEDAAVERALCNAQHLGSIDGAAPERAHQDIPPSVQRFVWHRDGGRCRVDGCRSARGLEIHHLVHRADGGTHEPSNVALLCSSCHAAHHRGALTVTGTADQLVIHRPGQLVSTARVPVADESAHVGVRASASSSDRAPASSAADRSTPVGARTAAASERAPVSSAADRSVHLGASRLDAAILRTQAREALVGLGWKTAIAGPAVTAAAT